MKMSGNVEKAFVASLTALLLCALGFKVYQLLDLRARATDFATIPDQLEMMEKIEGANLVDLVKSGSDHSIQDILDGKSGIKFVVILTDSTCYPCFGSYVANYIFDLEELGIEIDPTQWHAIFVGTSVRAAETVFKGTFGQAARVAHIGGLDLGPSLHDAYLLFLTERNFVLASSGIFNSTEPIRRYFTRRVANYLHPPKKGRDLRTESLSALRSQ